MFVVILALALFGGVYGNVEDFRKLDSIRSELPCTRAGGLCVIAADCPSGNLAEEKGLCPEQQSKGVECCYGLSMKETRCEKQGGVCIPYSNTCNPKLVFGRATNCPENQKCCILVQ